MKKRRSGLEGLTLLGGIFLTAVACARAETPQPEIVVAIRYLQPAGTSHAHLYLYREDGKLLRQLTKDDGGQDRNPVFAPEGETIVFTRELPKDVKQWWSLEPQGGNLRQLPAAPEWYAQAKSSPHFDIEGTGQTPADAATPTSTASPTPDEASETHRAPDGSVELVLTMSDDSSEDLPQGRDFLLRNLRSGKAVKMSKLPGFEELQSLLSCPEHKPDPHFLQEGALQVVFFGTHLNSTDGTTVHALDLKGGRFVRLSPNWAAPFPLSGEAAFLTATEERYVPFGDGKHTANCAYVDHWDAGLKKIRYAREKAPATCYGASMYRPGQQPAVVTIHDEEEP